MTKRKQNPPLGVSNHFRKELRENLSKQMKVSLWIRLFEGNSGVELAFQTYENLRSFNEI